MRQTYKGGDKLFVDYCGTSVVVVDPNSGIRYRPRFLSLVWGQVTTPSRKRHRAKSLPHWFGSHQRALAFYGGVPAAIVPDNLKSGISDPCRYEPGINRSYQEFAEHYGVAIIPARVKKPRDKAKVEKAVQEVERQILAPLRHECFSSFSTLNQAMGRRLQQLNDRVMQGYGLSRRQLFERTDQAALKPLPIHPFVLARWKQAKVNLDYHIEVERHYYSVPYWFVRHEVGVKISEQFIEIFYDHKRIAAHPRGQASYHYTTLAEHMPPHHWAYKQPSRERFLAWAQRIGSQTQAQVEAIFGQKAHEEQAFRTLKGIQRLATEYGCQRLEAACKRANLFNMIGFRCLKAILKSHLDAVPVAAETPVATPIDHDNVRGQTDYS